MLTLGYWNIRGRAQPLRFLLAYLKADFQEKRYEFTDNAWFGKDKQGLGLDLPNLPYVIDGNFSLTESTVIPLYLVRKFKRFDLMGMNPDGSISDKQLRVQQNISAIHDFLNGLYFDIFKGFAKFEDIKEKVYTERHEGKYQKLINSLGNQDYLVGNLTYADFMLYEVILYFKHLYPQVKVPHDYIQRIENIPEIKEYISSPKYIAGY